MRRFERAMAMRRWLQLDPQSALAEAERDTSGAFGNELFAAWVELDPRAALDALNRSSGPLVGKVVEGFFIALMGKDPAMAAEEVRKDKWWNAGTNFLGWNFHRNVMRQWFLADSPAAIAALIAEGDKIESNQDLQVIGEEWAKADFAAVWKQLTHDADGTGRITWFAQGLLARGLNAGNLRALEVLDQIPDETQRMGAVSLNVRNRMADVMIWNDAQAALKWAMTRPEGDPLRQQIIGQSASNFASSDPELALEMLQETGGDITDYQMSGIPRAAFARLTADDPVAAAEKIHSQPDAWKTGAMNGYLTQMFTTDPGSAIEQCRVWLNDPDLKSHVPEAWRKSFSWGQGSGVRDPSEALAALPELNDAVDEDVLSTWTKANPESAADWILQRLEDGKKVKLGNEGILAELAISKPEFTASWLLDLPDAGMQAHAAETLTANWGAYDTAAARAWIDSLPAGELRAAAEKGFTRIRDSR